MGKMRKTISVLLIFFLLLGLAGCAGLQRKFTRKKKEPVKKPRIYQIKKYEKKPSVELYKKHYAYWVTWQSELIKVLGYNHKKDMRCIEEIVSNLKDMQNILVREKAEEMAPHIARLSKVKDAIFKEELTEINRTYVLATLEREDRTIKREFNINKVKNSLRKSFDDGSKNAD